MAYWSADPTKTELLEKAIHCPNASCDKALLCLTDYPHLARHICHALFIMGKILARIQSLVLRTPHSNYLLAQTKEPSGFPRPRDPGAYYQPIQCCKVQNVSSIPESSVAFQACRRISNHLKISFQICMSNVYGCSACSCLDCIPT